MEESNPNQIIVESKEQNYKVEAKEKDLFKIEQVNFEKLKRLCAFQTGLLEYENYYEKTSDKKNAKKKFMTCATMPDILPIQLKQKREDVPEAEETKLEAALQLLPKRGDSRCEDAESSDKIVFDPSLTDDKKREFLSKFELVKTRKLTYDLPILIIYNGASGKQANLVPLIETRLKMEKIPYELKPTKKRHDTYFYAKEADLSKYSLLVAAGGDGSYHEVVNGMLARPDKAKLPVAMLPNGSGNDTCTSMGVKNLDDALNYIVNAEVIALDTVRCLIDFDEYEQIPEKQLLTNCRHMLINATLAMPAKIANEAQKYKKCCGKNCYAVATLQEAALGRMVEDLFTVEVDGVKLTNPNQPSVNTILLMLFNGKYTGGGMIVDPFAVMNDGLLDITWVHDQKIQNLKGIADMLDKAKTKGGCQIYDRACHYVRGKKVKLNFGGVKGKTAKKTGWGQQLVGIDGEDLRYDSQLIFECVPGNVEFTFDSQKFFTENKLIAE